MSKAHIIKNAIIVLCSVEELDGEVRRHFAAAEGLQDMK